MTDHEERHWAAGHQGLCEVCGYAVFDDDPEMPFVEHDDCGVSHVQCMNGDIYMPWRSDHETSVVTA